jgi:hypothetical protein
MFVLLLLSTAQASPCVEYARPVLLARLRSPELTESSGLAASRVQDGVFYTHNDSGAGPRLYRFSLDGGAVASFDLEGIGARDWEDMASGPCPDEGDCIYIGDIGDNRRRRDRIQVAAFRESHEGVNPKAVASWSVRYPEGVLAQDSETLLVHPRTKRLYLVTKESREPSVFRFPQRPGEGDLEHVAQLTRETVGHPLPKLTAGDFSHDGLRVTLRGYLSAWEWEVDPVNPEEHWAKEPSKRLSIRLERQGEALTYDATGRVFTSSEGSPMPLTRIACRR